jgi:hypothetical protein
MHPTATSATNNNSTHPKIPNPAKNLKILEVCIGISAVLILITALVGLLVVAVEYKTSQQKER